MHSSKKITEIKNFWKKENYINKNDIIKNENNIIDQISQFFASGTYYYYVFNFSTLTFEFISEGVKEVLEIDPDAFSLDAFLKVIPPEHLEKLHQKEQIATKFLFNKISPNQIMDYKVVYTNRIITKSGVPKTILHQAKAIELTNTGKISKVIGVHTDISYLRTAIDHNVSFISYNLPSYYSVSLKELEVNNNRSFTNREVEIIELISYGNSIAEISKLLFISPETVKTHRKNIFKKADVKNAAHLITKCIREGVI